MTVFDPAQHLAVMNKFGSNPGSLQAKTYIPQNFPKGGPLVVVLHGCRQTAGSYDYGSGWSTLADQHGVALLFPEQSQFNNSMRSFNWFKPGDNRRGGGEDPVSGLSQN